MSLRIGAVAAVLLAARTAAADGGELFVEAYAGADAAQVSYRAPDLRSSDVGAAGRVGARGVYGITNAWHLQLGAEMGWGPLHFRNLELAGVVGTLSADQLAGAVLLGASYLLNRGDDWSGRFGLDVGVAMLEVQERSFVEPSRPEVGLPVTLGAWGSVGFATSAEAEAVWRPLDWFAVAVGVRAGIRILFGAPAWEAGGFVRVSGVFGVGPSW